MTVFRMTAFALLVAVGTVGATASMANDDAIKYRQSVFKAIGGHMTAMATIVKTGAGDIKDVAAHANAMAAMAAVAPSIFPDGSGPMDGTTRAKAEIWDKPAEFKAVLDAFKAEADKLAAVAASGDKGDIGKQLGALGKNGCKACHDNFRAPKS